jgi:hypothetical protein
LLKAGLTSRVMAIRKARHPECRAFVVPYTVFNGFFDRELQPCRED